MEATGQNLITLDLPSTTASERLAHAELLLNLEAKKIASSIDVPTLPHDVQSSLRSIGQPIRMFGENNANIRDRLRMCLARIEVEKQSGGFSGLIGMDVDGDVDVDVDVDVSEISKGRKEEDKALTSVQYTHATEELMTARKFMARYSIERSKERLQRERKRRWGGTRRLHKRLMDGSSSSVIQTFGGHNHVEEYDEATVLKELDEMDSSCQERYNKIKSMALEGSQYGDGRPLSAIATARQPTSSQNPCLIATGGWTGSIKLWDGSTPALDLLATKYVAHEDRIMSVAMHQGSGSDGINSNVCQLASASIDLTGKLWKVTRNENVEMDNDDENSLNTDGQKANQLYKMEQTAVLKGHAARLCKVAYHPSGKYAATTSFDHTWRLWDIETGGKEIQLQDGHWKEVYGIGFHPDGSLLSTTDFGSVVQVWDLRTGKSACHFLGHAKRVLCAEFSPNGFQLATAGDDGTVKIWDMRQRKLYASIPAHSRLVTQIQFAHDGYGQHGEFLTSCSFDGTAKVWSTRNWKLLSTLRGHEGKVMGAGILDGMDAGIVTCGYDKTMKIWR